MFTLFLCGLRLVASRVDGRSEGAHEAGTRCLNRSKKMHSTKGFPVTPELPVMTTAPANIASAMPEYVSDAELSPDPASSQPSRASQLRTFFLAADEALEGRRIKLVLSAVLYQSILAPALDRAVQSLRDVSAVAGIARSAGHIAFAGFQFFSLLGALLVMSVLLLVLGGRIATLAAESGGAGRREALRELRILLSTELKLLSARPVAERLTVVGFAVYTLTLTMRDVFRVVRWAAWQGPLAVLGLQETFLASPFEWMYSFENILELISLSAICLAVVGLIGWVMSRQVPREPARWKNLRALSAVQPIVRVQMPELIRDTANQFHGDVVHRCLETLADWKPSGPLTSEKGVQLELYEYFRQAGFVVGFEEQIGGRNRVDLTLNSAIAIELKFGRLGANERNRAKGQVETYAQRWLGRGPLLLVCVGASEDKIADVARTVAIWNCHVSDHAGSPETLPAPILVVTQVGERKLESLVPA